MVISLEEVQRRILIGLFSDDELMDTLVLKGGNALALVHKVGSRASLDMDFSIKAAFSDLDKTGKRIFAALQREFGSVGYVVFDEKFEVKPATPGRDQPEWWGGYQAEFKLVERSEYEKLRSDLPKLRMRAAELGPLHKRKYTIDISRQEFCEGKQAREVDHYAVYVYSLEMIAAEKLRAICQQMPEYTFARTRTPRARDFYDIHQIVTQNGIDLASKKNLSTPPREGRPPRALGRYSFRGHLPSGPGPLAKEEMAISGRRRCATDADDLHAQHGARVGLRPAHWVPARVAAGQAAAI
jgi:predicted nucleotidyltransferase component of viral defense system